MDSRSRRERLAKRVRERAALREINGEVTGPHAGLENTNPEGGAPDSRFNIQTWVDPKDTSPEAERLRRVGKILGEWWDAPEDEPFPDLDGDMAGFRDMAGFHEANRAYREHFGEGVPVMEMQVITQAEAARAAWRAIKTNKPIVPPPLPPGCLTGPE